MGFIGIAIVACAAWLSMFVQCVPAKAGQSEEPKTVRDILWVWGNPELVEKGPHTVATFREASPAQRAELLGVPNVIMAGMALPDDEKEGERLTQESSGAKRLVWETRPDGPGVGPPFVYKERMTQVRRLAEKYPHIEGVLLDDMSTGKIDRGFKPEHIRDIKAALADAYPRMGIWGVVYSMSLGRHGMIDYLREVDVINLWIWDAKDVVKLEKYVANVETMVPGKPIVLGLYLYDYGGDRAMPLDLLEKQCDTALKLARLGRIQGIVFLTIHNDAQAVGYAAEWVKRVGDLPIRRSDERPLSSPTATRLPATGPAWVEGKSGSILRAIAFDGRILVERSTDAGLTWMKYSSIDSHSGSLFPGYLSRASDGSILFTLNSTTGSRHVSWIRSSDGGLTWSDPVLIMSLPEHYFPYGPIIALPDGRWAYCPYYENHAVTPWEARPVVMWSSDQGRTWSQPASFPAPDDGNQGLTECAVTQLEAGKYVAAIRADEAPGNDNAFDGFYLSYSDDGTNWSKPQSLRERGRMPLFYRIGNLWALTYRIYDVAAGLPRSAVRFSRNGTKWSDPVILESGVDAGAQLVQVKGKTVAFNTRYPDRQTQTRILLKVPAWVRKQLDQR